jgi:hypothetical protein
MGPHPFVFLLRPLFLVVREQPGIVLGCEGLLGVPKQLAVLNVSVFIEQRSVLGMSRDMLSRHSMFVETSKNFRGCYSVAVGAKEEEFAIILQAKAAQEEHEAASIGVCRGLLR